MRETVLLYNFKDEKRAAAAKRALVLLGVRIRMVEKKDYLKPVGVLAGLPDERDGDWSEYGGEEFAEEMMVIAGMTSRRIDMLLAGLRKSGVGRVNLKAVLTPSNCLWDSVKLYGELEEEHRRMNPVKEEPGKDTGSCNF